MSLEKGLIVAAFILFAVEFLLTLLGTGIPRVNLIAAGLACWVLAIIVGW